MPANSCLQPVNLFTEVSVLLVYETLQWRRKTGWRQRQRSLADPPPPAPAAGPSRPDVTSTTAMPRVLERLQEFDPGVDNMSTYLERLELYFEANAVEASQKVSVFLTVIGAKAYDTLRSLLAPTLPLFPELLAILKQHFNGDRRAFSFLQEKPVKLFRSSWLICGS